MYCLCEKYRRSGTVVDTARPRCSSQKLQPICRVRVRLIKRGWVLELPNRKADLRVIAWGRFLLRNIALIWSKLRRRLQPRRRSARRTGDEQLKEAKDLVVRSAAIVGDRPASRAYQRSAKSQSVSWHGDTSRQIIHQDQTLVPPHRRALRRRRTLRILLDCIAQFITSCSPALSPPLLPLPAPFFTLHSHFCLFASPPVSHGLRRFQVKSTADTGQQMCVCVRAWVKHCSVIQHLKCSWAKWPNSKL